MADDIVGRLQYAAWLNPSEGDTAEAHFLAADALAEIERLRSAGDALAATWPEEDQCNCSNADCRAVVAAFAAWKEARRGS